MSSRKNSALQKSVALPLASALVCLIVYASLYPFADWRDQGISPLTYLTAPWPQYLVGFDVAVNVAGYAPLGFLLTLAFVRSGRTAGAVCLLFLRARDRALAHAVRRHALPRRRPPFGRDGLRTQRRYGLPRALRRR